MTWLVLRKTPVLWILELSEHKIKADYFLLPLFPPPHTRSLFIHFICTFRRLLTILESMESLFLTVFVFCGWVWWHVHCRKLCNPIRNTGTFPNRPTWGHAELVYFCSVVRIWWVLMNINESGTRNCHKTQANTMTPPLPILINLPPEASRLRSLPIICEPIRWTQIFTDILGLNRDNRCAICCGVSLSLSWLTFKAKWHDDVCTLCGGGVLLYQSLKATLYAPYLSLLCL